MRPVEKCFLLSLLPAFFLIAADAATPKNTNPSANSTTATMPPAVVPLFIEDGDFSSTLVLVNGSAVQTYADVTVRALDGTDTSAPLSSLIPKR